MFLHYLLLIAAALSAGAMNALAGGGSFFTFPALVYTGVPALAANASSTVALFPGSFASAWAYRRDRRDFKGVSFAAILGVSILGGVSGALLLLFTPQRSFDRIIPWLLLLATLAFSFGPRLSPVLRRRFRLGPAVLLSSQFLVAVYGGYFGGAVGLILLALWSMFGVEDIKMMNANRVLLGGSMNAAAVVCFVIAGKIFWSQTMVMLVSAVAGGYLGARLVRRLDPRLVRALISIVSVCVTVAFFLRLR